MWLPFRSHKTRSLFTHYILTIQNQDSCHTSLQFPDSWHIDLQLSCFSWHDINPTLQIKMSHLITWHSQSLWCTMTHRHVDTWWRTWHLMGNVTVQANTPDSDVQCHTNKQTHDTPDTHDIWCVQSHSTWTLHTGLSDVQLLGF